MQRRLKLYGTLGCHLCDEAQVLLAHCNLKVEIHDIMDDDESYEKYSQKIPVLVDSLKPDKQPLSWPFNKALLIDWLSSK